MSSYKIVRYFQQGDQEVIEEGLSLEEAQEHCGHPETSSRTATSDAAIKRTDRYGHWFDGYREE